MITLELPPSVNHCYRRLRYKSGKVINALTDEAKNWMDEAINSIDIWCSKADINSILPTSKWWILGLKVFWPDKRRRDAGNLIKLLEDAFSAGTDIDDRWFLTQVWDIQVDQKQPRIEAFFLPKGKECPLCRVA